MGGKRPFVAEGILEFAVTVAPEHFLDWHHSLGSGSDGALENFVNVGQVEVNGDGRSVKLLGRAAAEFGKLIAEHEEGIADFEFGVHNGLAIGTGHTTDLFGAEDVFVKVDSRRGVADVQVRGDGMKTVRNWFCCHIKRYPFSGATY